MNKFVNDLAIEAKKYLLAGDESKFENLYRLNDINLSKQIIMSKSLRKYFPVLNEHDTEEVFDDTFLKCVLDYKNNHDFISGIFHHANWRMISRFRTEMSSKKFAIHSKYITHNKYIFPLVAKNNTEVEGNINVMMTKIRERFGERELELINLRINGASHAEVSKILGYRNKQQAHRVFQNIKKVISKEWGGHS